MGLAAPDLVEYLERQPLRFGHTGRIRWIHLAGGMLFVTLALFGLIREDGDFASGTLYRPLLSYVHIGVFLLLGILMFAQGKRLNWKLLLHAAVADLIYRYWRGGRTYPDTIEVSRRGVTSRSETGRTTFLSWGDLSAAQFKKTKAGIEIRSVDGSRVLRVGELRYEPLFWQIFWAMGGASWVMGGARPSDT